MTPDDRLIEIETKLSYQEILIEKLNEVVSEQQRVIDRLDGALKDLAKRIREGSQEPEIGPANEKPPHY